MTGIAGCLALAAGTRPDADWAIRAAARMAHRGPDDDGAFSDVHVALSARELVVTDPSADGRQPLRSADGRYCIVFDGAVYNGDSLAEKLRERGVRLRGSSDAEVVLELYAHEGKDVLRQLRGMYAFVIWDARDRELFCGRDPFGMKPLYYALADGGRQLRFASERKALAPPGEVPAIDPDALRRYLSFQYVPAPSTMTPSVRSLPPGHFLTARPGGPVDVFRYWRPILRPSRSPSADTPERILSALRDSVTAHLHSDAPVGALLSGGVDSAAICALAAQTRPGMLTFTAGFERRGYSEIEEAESTAYALGLRNVSYVITAQEFVSHLPQIIWQLDDPLADAAAIPLWFIAREASKHVKVVLSGEGADELFGGYGIYYQPAAVRAATRLPGLARNSAGALAARMAPGARGKGLLNRVATPLRDRYIGNAHVFTLQDVDALTRYGEGTVFDVTDPLFDQAAEAELDDVATMQLIDINTWLPGDILVKADRTTMAHGLQLRSPFLDREVMAVAARLSRAEKTAAGKTKFALREAIGGLLPQEAAERQKLGFPVPIGQWFRGELAGFPEHVIREAATDQWLDKRSALEVARRFRDGDPDVSWRQVWSLVVFSLWHQIYAERVFDPVTLGWEGGHPPAALPPSADGSRDAGPRDREREAGARDGGPRDREVVPRDAGPREPAPRGASSRDYEQRGPGPRDRDASRRDAGQRDAGTRDRVGGPREPRPRDRDAGPREPASREPAPPAAPAPGRPAVPAGPTFSPAPRSPSGQPRPAGRQPPAGGGQRPPRPPSQTGQPAPPRPSPGSRRGPRPPAPGSDY